MAIDKNTLDLLREFQEEGEPDFLKQLFDLFSANSPELVQRMEKGVESGDLGMVARSAHNLKSQAGNLGARRLSILCGEVEISARTNPAPLERIAALVETLRREYEESLEELRNLVAG